MGVYVFSIPELFQSILEYVPSYQLDRLRFVSKKWNEYLQPIIDTRYKSIIDRHCFSVSFQERQERTLYRTKTFMFPEKQYHKDTLTFYPTTSDHYTMQFYDDESVKGEYEFSLSLGFFDIASVKIPNCPTGFGTIGFDESTILHYTLDGDLNETCNISLIELHITKQGFALLLDSVFNHHNWCM